MYLANNPRELELTRNLSLALTQPLALVRLLQTGSATITLDESLFDHDHPGQYFRRLRAVELTFCCRGALLRRQRHAGTGVGGGADGGALGRTAVTGTAAGGGEIAALSSGNVALATPVAPTGFALTIPQASVPPALQVQVNGQSRLDGGQIETRATICILAKRNDRHVTLSSAFHRAPLGVAMSSTAFFYIDRILRGTKPVDLPVQTPEVRRIFSRKGAYARFKDLLDRRGALDHWYDFEAKVEEKALRMWCDLNSIEVGD